jgi:integrase
VQKYTTDASVARLRPAAKRYAVPDAQQPGHYVRVTPNGERVYYAAVKNPSHKMVWHRVGSAPAMKVDEAREEARKAIKRIKEGLPPVEPKKESFGTVSEQWMKRHVGTKGLRSAAEYRRILDRYILPKWGDTEFTAIRRSDVTKLLDRIQDKAAGAGTTTGARQADATLAVIRGIMNWFESRNDDYRSPIAKGMKRVAAKDKSRERILTDDEIRKVWAAASGTYGAIIKLCLLTAQRLDKVVTLKWTDLSDGVLTIAGEDREKGNAGELVLPRMALDVIEAQPRFESNPYVFAGQRRYFNGFSKAKATLDKASSVEDWVTHDLRRTARSLMSRAGVTSDHAERVLGHAIQGVEGVYDRHAYREEKRIALAKLAALIDGVVNPRDNVIPLAST